MSLMHELSYQKECVAGLKQVLRCARMSMLEKVYIAKDADEDIIDQITAECNEHRIPFDQSLTMHQIGSACSIDVGSACAGIIKKDI